MGKHPFSFRTRKLSPLEPMVLLYWGRVGSRQVTVFNFLETNICRHIGEGKTVWETVERRFFPISLVSVFSYSCFHVGAMHLFLVRIE